MRLQDRRGQRHTGATDFAVRDGYGEIAALAGAKKGKFRLSPTRSAVHLPGAKAFLRNTEMEATVTLAHDMSSDPGQYAEDVRPTPMATTGHSPNLPLFVSSTGEYPPVHILARA